MSLRPSWIMFGWFIAASTTALVLFALIASGVVGADGGDEPLRIWLAIALAIGFAAGGFVTGVRAGDSPVLHGLAIGAVSVILWLVVNMLGSIAALTPWTALSLSAATFLLVLQGAAAVVGARAGVDWRYRRVERES